MKKTPGPWTLLSTAIFGFVVYLILRNNATVLHWGLQDNLDQPAFVFVRDHPALLSVGISLLLHVPLVLLEPAQGKRIFTRTLGPILVLLVIWLVHAPKANFIRVQLSPTSVEEEASNIPGPLSPIK